MTIFLAPGSDLTKTLPFVPGMPTLDDVTLTFLEEEFGELLPPFQFREVWGGGGNAFRNGQRGVGESGTYTQIDYQILISIFLAPGSVLTKRLSFVPNEHLPTLHANENFGASSSVYGIYSF